jgi:hypothetical protein
VLRLFTGYNTVRFFALGLPLFLTYKSKRKFCIPEIFLSDTDEEKERDVSYRRRVDKRELQERNDGNLHVGGERRSISL